MTDALTETQRCRAIAVRAALDAVRCVVELTPEESARLRAAIERELAPPDPTTTPKDPTP